MLTASLNTDYKQCKTTDYKNLFWKHIIKGINYVKVNMFVRS